MEQVIGVLIAGLVIAVVIGTALKGIVRVISYAVLAAIAVLAVAEVTGRTNIFPMFGSSFPSPGTEEASPESPGQSTPFFGNGEGDTTTSGSETLPDQDQPDGAEPDPSGTQSPSPSPSPSPGAPQQGDEPVNALW